MIYSSQVFDTDFRGVHNDSGDEVKEDVVAVGADTGVAEGHLQLIHGLQKKTFSLILQVFKGGFLVVVVVYEGHFISNITLPGTVNLGDTISTDDAFAFSSCSADLCNEI